MISTHFTLEHSFCTVLFPSIESTTFITEDDYVFIPVVELSPLSSMSIIPTDKWIYSLESRSSKFKFQYLSSGWLFAIPLATAHQASLSITNSRSLPKLLSIELVRPSNRLILCHPLLLLPSIFPNIRVFSNESFVLIRCPKYWHFSFSISPSNEHSRLISFRKDWLDFVAVQGTFKILLQQHSSKASILWVQLSL